MKRAIRKLRKWVKYKFNTYYPDPCDFTIYESYDAPTRQWKQYSDIFDTLLDPDYDEDNGYAPITKISYADRWNKLREGELAAIQSESDQDILPIQYMRYRFGEPDDSDDSVYI